MDKGREAIVDLVIKIFQFGEREGYEAGMLDVRGKSTDLTTFVDKAFNIIRANRYVHLDDVVEGRTVCTVDKCAHLPENRECTASACTDATILGYQRPATVGDLIGGKNEGKV